MQIDLATRFLPKTHQVFVIHPGDRKKFYDQIRAGNWIFLDIPGAHIDSSGEFYSVTNVSNLIMSQDIVRWHNGGAEPTKEPSRNPKDYESGAKRFLTKRGSYKRLSKLVPWAQGVYQSAQAGDLVVVSGGGYFSDVLIGEIVDTDISLIDSDYYPGESIPARRVRWLSKGRRKVEFSEELIKQMQIQSAVIRLSAIELRDEIYTEAYGQYVYGDEAQLEILIDKPKVDFRDLTSASLVPLYFAALHVAFEKDQLDTFLNITDPQTAIDQYYDPAYFTDTSITLNSPGVIHLIAKSPITAAVVGALLALSAANYSPAADDIKVTNSAQTTTSCEWQIQEELKTIFAHWDYARWQLLCQRRQEAAAKTGMDTAVKIKSAPQKSKPAQP